MAHNKKNDTPPYFRQYIYENAADIAAHEAYCIRIVRHIHYYIMQQKSRCKLPYQTV